MIHAHYKAPFMKVLQGFLDCRGVPKADVICSAEVVCVCIYLIMCVFLFVWECVCLCIYIYRHSPAPYPHFNLKPILT